MDLLHEAVRQNRVEDVRRMLEDPDVDPNYQGNWHRLPFMAACSLKQPEMAALFLGSKREINYNQGNSNNWTGLHYACYHNNRAIMEMLLADQRIYLSVLTTYGETCFHTAYWAYQNYIAMEVLLASDRPEINQDYIAMEVLLASDRPEINQVLNARDNSARTPRDLAQEKGYTRMVELIDAYNADPIGTRDELRVMLYPEYKAAELFATIVLLCDDYYEIKE